jgi:hypothetical protein
LQGKAKRQDIEPVDDVQNRLVYRNAAKTGQATLPLFPELRMVNELSGSRKRFQAATLS